MTEPTVTGLLSSWERDGRARITSIAGEMVVVRTTKPGAPGSRPVGVLPSGSELRVKVHRCRKSDEGDGMVYTIDARLIDATKAQRAEIVELCGSHPTAT